MQKALSSNKRAHWGWGFLTLLLLLAACRAKPPEVIVYTSVDQPFAEPILQQFEDQTGIRVKAVYDVEAAKTTGLVNRLLAEKESPQADVFWNSEIIQTMLLQQTGVLAPYAPADVDAIPAAFRDPDGYWTAVGARARVLLVNTERVADAAAIDSLQDLLDPAWNGRDLAIALPLFGTTATHAVALYTFWGEDTAQAYFEALIKRGVNVLDGNSVVRDKVADGALAFGLTDTDDACGAVERGAPVQIIFPDQNGAGTLIIPGSAALVASGPNPDEGKRLLDYLTSAVVEQALLDSEYSHVPIHDQVEPSASCLSLRSIKAIEIDYRQVYTQFEDVQEKLRAIFLR